MDTSSIRDISIHFDTVLLYDPSWRVKRTLRRDLDCGDPRRRRYREKLLASSIGGDPVRVCVGVIVDHTDLSSIASSTIMSLTEISIWHLVYVELIFGRPHAVKPDVSYDGSDAVLALRYGHHAHDERVGEAVATGRKPALHTRNIISDVIRERAPSMVTGSEVVPENRGNRGGAGAGRKETALSPGSARRGARRTSGARNSSYGVGRSRDPVGGRGCATPALLVSLPGCRSRPSGATSTSRSTILPSSLTRLPNGFVG